MLTYRERYPEEFKEETENDKLKELEMKRSLKLVHAYETVNSELNAISFIDKEVQKEQRAKTTTPHPIPSKTGYSYQEWRKKNDLKHSLNRANICLNMRVTEKPKLQNSSNSALTNRKTKK